MDGRALLRGSGRQLRALPVRDRDRGRARRWRRRRGCRSRPEGRRRSWRGARRRRRPCRDRRGGVRRGGACDAMSVVERLDLPIEGMTCASCAARIERRLNKLEGVSASVNYATEKAVVDYDPTQADAGRLAAVVEEAGYVARLPTDERASAEPENDGLRRRLVVAAVLSLPVLALAMIPALQFRYWQWLSLLLATPVVLW